MANGSDPASGTAGPGSVGQVSVWQRLIELEFRNGFRIGGVESAGLLIEREEALGRQAQAETHPILTAPAVHQKCLFVIAA